MSSHIDADGRAWFHSKHFMPSLAALAKKGGPFARAAQQVHAILGRLATGGDPFDGMNLTHRGETRINKARKYDLTGRARLVTVHDERCVYLLFCGDHDAVDSWLDSHRGWVPLKNAQGDLTETFVTDGRAVGADPTVGILTLAGPLYAALEVEVYERLVVGLPRSLAREIEALAGPVSIPAIAHATDQIEDPERRAVMFDVLSQLARENPRAAHERAQLYFGKSVLLETAPAEALTTVSDSDTLRRLPIGSPDFAAAIRRFMDSVSYRDWMLFMRREQQEIVDRDFNGPAKLVGVSGSGKTCVVVQRAVRLAHKYASERILILTLNPALARLVEDLVSSVAEPDVSVRIECLPLFDLCRRILVDRNPEDERRLREVTWRLNESVDEIWREYYRCDAANDDARVFHSIHDSLLQRGVFPSSYLREEVEWLRSALTPERWGEYVEIERKGRAFNLLADQRRLVLDGTAKWVDKMGVIGVVDGLQIVNEVMALAEDALPQFRCVLIDEAQDFGNVELALARRLVAPGENDMFLCGDAAQAVTTKYQHFREAGIDVPGARSLRLSQNYRNSKDILKAAHRLLVKNLSEELLSRVDFEIFDPDLSAFSDATPVLLRATSLEDELARVIAYARQHVAEHEGRTACVAVCGYSLHEMRLWASAIGLPLLDGTISIDQHRLVLADLEQTKGFEFDLVCIANVCADVLPNPVALPDEHHRDLARLYVALTRARRELFVSYAGTVSPFFAFADIEEVFYSGEMEEYAPAGAALSPPLPTPIAPEAQPRQAHMSWREMTGHEFLHSRFAVGIDAELAGKVRQLVDGKGLRRANHRSRWQTMGVAADDFRGPARPFTYRYWGPETGAGFERLVVALETLSPG